MKNQSGEDQEQITRDDEHDEGWYHLEQSGAERQSKEQKTDERLREEVKDRLPDMDYWIHPGLRFQ